MMSSFEWMELQTLTSDIEAARTRLLEARKHRDHGRIRALEDEITQAEKRRLQLVAHISTSIAAEPGDEGDAGRNADRAAGAAGGPDPATAEPEGSAATVAAAETAEAAVTEDAAAVADASAQEPADDTTEAADEPPPVAETETARARKPRGGAAEAEPAEEAADRPETNAPASEPQTEAIEVAAQGSPAPAAKAVSSEGGITMWDQLTPTDLDRAKRELGMRRAEMLARHAEELKALEVEQGQIDVLEQAIQSFLQKFNAAGGDAAVVKLDQERELRQQGNN